MISLHRLTICISLLVLSITNAMTDPATGVTFASKLKDLSIFGVGVRKKGPIKVYSVAMYAPEPLRELLQSFSRTRDKIFLMGIFRNRLLEGNSSFVLKMNMKVGTQKMAQAIADSVLPRYPGPSVYIRDLKGKIMDGFAVKGAATKGSTLQFDCGEGVNVSIDGVDQGAIDDKDLAKAFCNVFLDDHCVSPALKESILDNCQP
mmetsp:Transcript_36652/g.56299  ORF Transcript_36652/g.56299 Transcript_36652/m.56299 type:complete len:204 (-) Transcript_36652:580-1191(-)